MLSGGNIELFIAFPVTQYVAVVNTKLYEIAGTVGKLESEHVSVTVVVRSTSVVRD